MSYRITKNTHRLTPVANSRLAAAFGLALAFATTASYGESLMDVYHLAAKNEPQFQAAQATLAAAQEALPQSKASFFPSLDASGRYIENSDSNIDAIRTYSLTLTQPLYRRGNYVQYSTAKSAVAQAEAEFVAAKQSLIITVASAYFGVLSAQDNLDFTKAEKEANARQLEQTKQRFEVGLVAITDVHESQAAYDFSVAQTIAAENDLQSTKERLHEITGQYHDALAQLTENVPLVSPEPADLEEWTKRALDQNPSLKAIEFSTEQAREAISAQQAGNYPTLDLVVDHTNTEQGDFNNDENTAILWLKMNLFAGGSTASATRQARETYKSSQQLMEATKRSTERTVRNAYRGVISGISQVKALKQAMLSSQSALRAAEAGYEVGTRTTVDVLVARSNLFAAQRNYAQARYNYVINSLQLKEAAGMLVPDDLQALSAWLQ